MIVLYVVILIIYSALIIAFIIGFDRIKNFNRSNTVVKTNFSIVIPFKDEAENLEPLLNSLSKLNYPKEFFEIIFVDDESRDNSVKIINNFKDKFLNEASINIIQKTQPNILILNNNRKSGSPKKDAIKTAINQANFNWILTTDADCIVQKNWLQIFDNFIQQYQPKLIAAPVTYIHTNSLFEQFQLLDFLSLQGTTIGGFGINRPFMCNGANLCYEKQAFLDLNTFKGNEHIASGDDVFLLEKMSDKYPDKVHFLKSNKVIIYTKPESTFKKLFSQRIRWAAKATSYKNSFSKLVSISVFSMNFLIILLFLASIIGYFSYENFILFFLIKFCLDFILLFKTATFFKQKPVLKHYFWSSFVYPFFITFIAFSSFSIGFSWKGRSYKK